MAGTDVTGGVRLWLPEDISPALAQKWLQLYQEATERTRRRGGHKQRGDARNLDSHGVKLTPHRSMSLVQTSDGQAAFVKHFHPSEPYKVLLQKLRGRSNARVVYETGREMARRGILTPRTLALVENKSGSKSFLIMESVAELPTVQQLLKENSRHPNSRERRRRKKLILRSFAKEWRRLHDAGIDYAESHDRHVYIAGSLEEFFQDSESGWHFVWIDYDGTQFHETRTPDAAITKQLFMLSRDYRRNKKHCRGVLNRTDMMRFLHYYLFGELAREEDQRQAVKKLADGILTWNPPASNRVMQPIREALHYISRPEERLYKSQQRERMKRKRARQHSEMKSATTQVSPQN